MPNNWPGTLAEVGQSHPRSYRKGGERKINREMKEGWREWGGKARRKGVGFISRRHLPSWAGVEDLRSHRRGLILPELILSCASVTAVPAANPLSHWHR